MAFGIRLPDIVGLFTDTILGGSMDGGSFTVQELTGEQRVVVLRGRAKPYRPLAFASSMRTKNTWYQGNPVSTQQVLGPELDPTTVEGKWKDRFIAGAEADGGEGAILVNNDPDAVQSADAAVALFESIRSGGNAVRVVWGSRVREGILVFFKADYDRQQDIAWTMEFEWHSEGQQEVRAVEIPTNRDDLLNGMNSLDDILGFSPEDVAQAFNAQLLDTIQTTRAAVGDMFGVLRAANTVVSTPASVAGGVSAAAESIRLELTEEIGRLTENPVFSTPDSAVMFAVSPSSVMLVEAYRRTTARRAASVRCDALNLDRQERAVPVIQVVPVPQDTSLYTLSVRYYGTPDFANFLADANDLTSKVVPAGFQLRIPPKPAGGQVGPDGADVVGTGGLIC